MESGLLQTSRHLSSLTELKAGGHSDAAHISPEQLEARRHLNYKLSNVCGLQVVVEIIYIVSDLQDRPAQPYSMVFLTSTGTRGM